MAQNSSKTMSFGVKSYRELTVWQRSIQLTVAIYRLTESFPKAELYGLVNQLRRAAVSVASNIAEGHGRLTTGEYKHFLGLARGSLCEVQTQLVVARELGFAESAAIDQCEGLSDEVGKMTNAMLARLRSNP